MLWLPNRNDVRAAVRRSAGWLANRIAPDDLRPGVASTGVQQGDSAPAGVRHSPAGSDLGDKADTLEPPQASRQTERPRELLRPPASDNPCDVAVPKSPKTFSEPLAPGLSANPLSGNPQHASFVESQEPPDPRARPTDRAPAFTGRVPPPSVWALDGSKTKQPWETQIGLLSQRIDVIAERVELLRERLDAATWGSRPRVQESATSFVQELRHLDRRLSQLEQHRKGEFAAGWTPPPVPGVSVPHRSSSTPTKVPRPTDSMLTGPVVSGILPDLSLTTLLGLFELERTTGVLSVECLARKLELELDLGRAVRCYLDGAPVSAVEGVREALSWNSGSFSFRKADVGIEEDEPLSVNAVLLAASRLDDEAAAG